MSVVLQDEAGGASTGGVLCLTNIHRLYDYDKRKKSNDSGEYDFMGPALSRAKGSTRPSSSVSGSRLTHG